jgi:hypothetical protein
VLIVEVDGIDLEPPERTLGTLFNAFGPTLLHLLPAGIDLDPEFRGDHHLPTERRERFSHEFFVCERAVDFGGIKERHAAFDRFTYQSNHFVFVTGRAVGIAHSHATEPDGRDFQIAFTKFAFLHF